MTVFLDDVPEGTPGHGDEFDREAAAVHSCDSGVGPERGGGTRWLVADPDLSRQEAEATLRSALTWPRAVGPADPALAGAAAAGGGAVGIATAIGALGLVEWPSWAALGAVGAAAGGIPVWAWLDLRARERTRARQRAATRVARESLVEVPASFASWARSDGRAVDHGDLVALARALSAARTAASTLDAWRWGEPDVDWPHAHAVVDPVLVDEYEAARAVLDELAARHGWTVPAEVAPESLR
ncbi:hypothetical protein ES689_14295 [Frigoribacterium sp. ACAM 257]|uniref:hypothetical protein n=1 Tax=Frigoribacterium sp. ACAM 257 TaxID=2508998 RepID=UPI0011BA35C3|nr:hypothetical protein [Frigoribacterium sp. ACAM 257]TWX35009.1 hypothetical protein ES689_14295 [Frigoribacterium sp. ACAM 257]